MTNQYGGFRTPFSEAIFRHKYAQGPNDSWHNLAIRLVDDVCGTQGGKLHPLMSKSERDYLVEIIRTFKFIPGGRYLYYAGRDAHFWNNCYLLRAEEDTREEWSALTARSMSALMSGGGIGVDYSRLREAGRTLSRTGGRASGPLPLMFSVNEIGRNVMQGGSRRSAMYASLNWRHPDIMHPDDDSIPGFLYVKNWHNMQIGNQVKEDGTPYTVWDVKQEDFNFPAPLDMTNISVNYDNSFLEEVFQLPAQTVRDELQKGSVLEPKYLPDIFVENVRQALETAEPGFSFNFWEKENETLRNAPVSGRTRVLTTLGYKAVEDIIGQEVKVWTGKQWANTTFKLTKKNVDTVEVFLSNGRSIVCDPEHPFIQWTKQGIKRTEAACLYKGDAILNTLPLENHIKSSDDGYGLGFVFGDGSVRNGRGEISYWHGSKKACFEKACEQLNAHTVSLPHRAYFKAYENKNIKPLPGFVAGWFDADGSYSRDLLRLSNKDKGTLQILQEILDYWGINSIVREDGGSSYKPENKHYTLQVLKSSFARFKDLIPTIRININVPEKVRKQNTLVVDVLDTGIQEDVYCCDVGVKEHAFMAEGVIISNCTEITSEDDSDVCNLGSINLGAVEDMDEFASIVQVASKFLVCGTLRADLPYEKVYKVREKNRRLGLGLMGIHEWLLKRGHKYEVVPELHEWLRIYEAESEKAANEHCDRFYISRPVAYRSIAPTGSIGILAATTTGIEPLIAVAYKRRYLKDKTRWHYQYVVDSTAETLVNELGANPNEIDTALSMADDFERRIKFQADIQDYVDMAISSTINLPAWGSKLNNEGRVKDFATTLAKYAPRLRGFTCYPDGARGGQPLTAVPYEDAVNHKGVEFQEHDICQITKGGESACGS